VRCAAAHCEQRAADARAVAWGARRLRCGRGEGETCGRDAVAERRCTRRIRVGRWRVRPRKAFAPKAQLSCVARTKVIHSGALPACENRARGNARSHGAAGHDSFRCGLRRSHRRRTHELRGRAETWRRDSPNQQAMQERRGAPFAARTVAFLFARACKRRDTPRAPARIPRASRWRARGAGRRAAKAMSFLCGSPGRGRDVCPERRCSRDTNPRCKRRDRAREGEANVNERANRTTRAGVKPRRRFCGWAAPVCSSRSAKAVTRRGGACYRV